MQDIEPAPPVGIRQLMTRRRYRRRTALSNAKLRCQSSTLTRSLANTHFPPRRNRRSDEGVPGDSFLCAPARCLCRTPVGGQGTGGAGGREGELLRQHRPHRRSFGRRAAHPGHHPQRHLHRLDEAGRQQPDAQGAAPARRTGGDPRGLRGVRQLLPGRRHRVLLLRPAGLGLQRSAGRARALGDPALRRRGRAGPCWRSA